ncbi:APC family permease [Natronosporangium hydrolyticum]|uniref:APC family permease n=1 Tax=Natronosporangium hydrolyticum TaxID=2811111 RepID=A0A895YGQ7_9ACTN|nr:APC family permease [Natronosporangium hydrolyticum]QSB13360.1 APC family permease [Natronosporangium hydrolyticum]
MASSTSLLKRLVVGRPFRSDQSPTEPTSLPKRVALPVFAADPLSSAAYAPAQMLMALSAGGAAAFVYAPWVAAGVALVLVVVVASYRQTVRAYPSGGGDYEVAATNLGPVGGLTVASALFVDYMLTVAVSVAAAIDHLGAIVPVVTSHRTAFALAAVALLVAINLRGVRQHQVLFAIPTYAFLAGMVALVGWGLWRILGRGDDLAAPSADLEVAGLATGGGVAGVALIFLLLRAFASGSVTLTGMQTLANQVPAFKAPKPRNAALAMLTVGIISILLLAAIVTLARLTGLQYVEDPSGQITGASDDYVQPPVTAQLAETIFGHAPVVAMLVVAATALVLFFAANTTFDGFPLLGARLASDRYLPRQLHTRGDRLAFSNGILLLGAGAGLLVLAFRADVVSLIHLYIVGVFTAFTLSQAGMVRHWTRLLRDERDPATRRHYQRARALQAFGASLTGAVLVVVLVAKFNRGAWISIAVMAILYLLMRAIRSHYDTVARELTPTDIKPVLPARNHAVVLVSKVHMPTMRALAYARATRPDTLTAVTVRVDPDDTRMLMAEWEGRGLEVPLTVIDSPYREITRPIIEYVKSIRRESPRDVVTVFIPEYVVGRWWENLLHNQSALRLKGRLHFESGVMVTSVPWQLASSSRKGPTDRMVRAPRTRDVPDFERIPED